MTFLFGAFLVFVGWPMFGLAIEAFGPRRCMFESNFPVDKQSCSYAVLWNAFKKIAAQATDEDRRWLFHDTAATAYRLRLLDQ